MLVNAKIVRKINGYYYAYINHKFNNISEFEEGLLLCKLKGSLKIDNRKDNCVVGDNVLIDVSSNSIIEVYNRKNIINRPLISNIDKIALTLSIKEPDFNFINFQKLLTIIHKNNLDAILIITKCDLASDEEIKLLNRLLKENFPYIKTFYLFKDDIKTINEFKKYILGNTFILTGLSGVGKSTLINKLIGFDILKTSYVSKKTKKGRNTTVDTRFFPLENGFIVDTPGFSSLLLPKIENELDIKEFFPEIKFLSNKCKFKNCIHIDEPNCNVKENLSKLRYEFYKYIINDWRKK